MSMHEIEGLVEDSVLLVSKSTKPQGVKRDILYNLYRFQEMFDTSYTHFRVIAILLDLKFVYRIPINQHPDYNQQITYFNNLDFEKTNWLSAEIGKKSELVYALKEPDGIFLYADTGSKFWQRLCKVEIIPKTEQQAPEKIKTICLIWQLLEEANLQDNLQLVRDWYAFMINTIGIDLGEEEGFSKMFLDFSATDEAVRIRSIGKTVKPFAKKFESDNWGYLTRPVLTEIEEDERNIERLYCIKWLLDFKTDEEKIKAKYLSEITPDPKKDEKLKIIPNAVEYHLGTENWRLVLNQEHKYGYKWLYYQLLKGEEGNPKDTDLHLYLLFDADTEDLKQLYPKIGIQSGLLCRWQGRERLHAPEAIHFLEPLTPYIPKADWQTNKNLHYMGGWKFSLKSSEKTLKKQVDDFFEYYKKYAAALLVEFEKPLFNNFQMTLKDSSTYRRKMEQTHRFFLNDIEVYLVYAMHHFEKGEKDKAFELAEKAKKLAQEKKHPIAKDWIAAAESILVSQPKLNELLSFERKL